MEPSPQSVMMEGVEFSAVTAEELSNCSEYRSVNIPAHRMTPLRKVWMELYEPLVKHMKLQVRMDLKKHRVEIRTSEHTKESNALQKGCDFITAFSLGFDIKDAIALLRLDDLYIESFDIKDVKTLNGEHLSRAIGRVAGQGGKTKFTIENATRTRIVLADTRIHLLGSFSNVKVARSAIVRLLRGAPPSKVYTQMRAVASRMKEKC
jgi:RNA-binding protein PNO1